MRTLFFRKGQSSAHDFRYWLDAINVADKPHLTALVSAFLKISPEGIDVWATGDRGHVQWMLRWLPALPENHVDWVAWSERGSRITSVMLTGGALKLLELSAPDGRRVKLGAP